MRAAHLRDRQSNVIVDPSLRAGAPSPVGVGLALTRQIIKSHLTAQGIRIIVGPMSTRKMSHAEANLAAEIRAVESGHRCYLTGENTARILSDSTPGLHWLVTAQATHAGAGIVFHCRPEGDDLCHGHGDRWSRTPGRLTCRHAAVLARRLERNGFAAWVDGMWIATEKAATVSLPSDESWRSDPFTALSRMAS